MTSRSTVLTTLLTASALAVALAAGCNDKKNSGNGMGGGGGSGQPLEGNPGATTNQSIGYPQSDPGGYHPQTDDTRQYHPADPAAVQPAH